MGLSSLDDPIFCSLLVRLESQTTDPLMAGAPRIASSRLTTNSTSVRRSSQSGMPDGTECLGTVCFLSFGVQEHGVSGGPCGGAGCLPALVEASRRRAPAAGGRYESSAEAGTSQSPSARIRRRVRSALIASLNAAWILAPFLSQPYRRAT